MENPRTNIAINTAVSACYVERAESIKEMNKEFITAWLKCVNEGRPRAPLCYEDYIKTEIVKAAYNVQTRDAILHNEHLWCNTTFHVPDSAVLFVQLAEMAMSQGLRDKVVFNCAERITAMHHLSFFKPGVRDLMADLQHDYGIRFYFWEDLRSMLLQRSPISV